MSKWKPKIGDWVVIVDTAYPYGNRIPVDQNIGKRFRVRAFDNKGLPSGVEWAVVAHHNGDRALAPFRFFNRQLVPLLPLSHPTASYPNGVWSPR